MFSVSIVVILSLSNLSESCCEHQLKFFYVCYNIWSLPLFWCPTAVHREPFAEFEEHCSHYGVLQFCCWLAFCSCFVQSMKSHIYVPAWLKKQANCSLRTRTRARAIKHWHVLNTCLLICLWIYFMYTKELVGERSEPPALPCCMVPGCFKLFSPSLSLFWYWNWITLLLLHWLPNCDPWLPGESWKPAKGARESSRKTRHPIQGIRL